MSEKFLYECEALHKKLVEEFDLKPGHPFKLKGLPNITVMLNKSLELGNGLFTYTVDDDADAIPEGDTFRHIYYLLLCQALGVAETIYHLIQFVSLTTEESNFLRLVLRYSRTEAEKDEDVVYRYLSIDDNDPTAGYIWRYAPERKGKAYWSHGPEDRPIATINLELFPSIKDLRDVLFKFNDYIDMSHSLELIHGEVKKA